MALKVLCIVLHSDLPQTEAFIGLMKAGVDIEVMTRPAAPHYERLRDAGVPLIDLALKSRFDLKGAGAIRAQLKAKRYDILHLFDNKSISNGILASWGIPVKIITYRGVSGHISYLDPSSWMTHLNPKVSAIACNSRSVAQYFLGLKCLGLELPPEKVVTLYKGHDLAWYGKQPADLSEFSIPEGDFVIGCTANFRPNKGVHLLIEALRHLPEDTPSHLLLIGKMDHPLLRASIDASPLRQRIHLAGFRSDAPALMAACDVTVLPTLRRESFSRSVVESMAYGIPPIVSAVGGNPELVEDGVSGLVFQQGNARDLAEKILLLRDDPRMRKEMGAAARRRIEQVFNVANTVRDTLRLYRDLADSRDDQRA